MPPQINPAIYSQVNNCLQGLSTHILAENLCASDGSLGIRKVMFCGTGTGVGTTSLCLAFARFLARRSRRKLLLVDANFSRPQLHKLLRQNSSPGLAEILMGKVDEFEPIAMDGGAFHFLPAGDMAALRDSLLFSESIATGVWDSYMANFDLIILDAAPPAIFSETLSLAQTMDGVILVSLAEVTRSVVCSHAVAQLNQAGAKILAGVVNRRRFHIPPAVFQLLYGGSLRGAVDLSSLKAKLRGRR